MAIAGVRSNHSARVVLVTIGIAEGGVRPVYAARAPSRPPTAVHSSTEKVMLSVGVGSAPSAGDADWPDGEKRAIWPYERAFVDVFRGFDFASPGLRTRPARRRHRLAPKGMYSEEPGHFGDAPGCRFMPRDGNISRCDPLATCCQPGGVVRIRDLKLNKT